MGFGIDLTCFAHGNHDVVKWGMIFVIWALFPRE